MSLSPYRMDPKIAACDLDLCSGVRVRPHLQFEGWREALREEDVRCYPCSREVQAAYATQLGLAREQVAVTAGADDAIDRVFRTVLSPGSEVLWTTPGFSMFPRYAQLCGATIRGVPWLDGEFPTEAYLAGVGPKTDLLVLVSPQNPTGKVVAPSEIEAVLTRVPDKVVLLDEAYVEFGAKSALRLISRYPNLVLIRTMSKAYGGAGLRVGFALGQPSMISRIQGIGSPFPVSGPSLRIAMQLLCGQEESRKGYIDQVKEERLLLVQLAEKLGDRGLPSQSNAVLWQSRQARWMYDALGSLGIAVRRWDTPEAQGMVRVGCPGNVSDFERLTQALELVRQPNLLLFDMDGVIFDVAESYRCAMKKTAGSFGIELKDSQIDEAKAAGRANDDWSLTQALLVRAGVRAPFDEVKARFESFYQDGPRSEGLWRRETLLVKPALLKRLATILPLGIVTGRPRRDAIQSLALHGIEALFSVIVCREDAALKPDPEPILLAMKRSQIQEPRAWYVGDTPDDVHAARQAGCVPIGHLSRGEGSVLADALRCAGVSRILSSIEELQELLS